MNNQTHRKSVFEKLRKYTAKYRVEEGEENVGKQIRSDPMETGCHGKSPSDLLEVSSRET